MNEKLTEYIKKGIESGHSIIHIKNLLLDAGHNITVVEEHINHVMKSKQNEKLRNFIKRHAEKGSDMEEVKNALAKAGHDMKIIEEYTGQAVENHINKKQSRRKYATIGIVGLAVVILIIAAFYFFRDNYKKNEFTVNETQLTEASHQKNVEIINKAMISNDRAVCEQVEDNKLKDECKNKFELNLPNKTADEDLESKELLNKALITQNASFCAEIKDESIQKQCGQILKR